MNTKQQELLDRLKKVIDSISRNPKTAAVVMPFLEDLVVVLEEVVEDLATTPDEQVAKNLREAIAKLL